jgi:spermidine synthase
LIKEMQKPEKLPLALVLLLFFVSGALALVYQVVWSRMMMQVFGSTALAVGTVLAAFMTGMASGSWYIGEIADKSRNCLRLYARLEIGIAVTALLSHVLLSQMAPAYPAIYQWAGSSAGVFAVVRFVMAFSLVALPTFLMGATLPVLTRYLLPRKTLVGINLSSLYASNTFGAVAGVLVTGFFLIGKFGIHVPVYLAVIGNLLIGGIAWTASVRIPGPEYPALSSAEAAAGEAGGPDSAVGPAMFRIILFGLGLSGLTSFAYEIYWTRSLVFILGNSTYALTTMLSAFLTGIALGGYLVRYLLRHFADRAMLFGWIQVFLGAFSAMALPLLFSVADIRSLNQYLISNADQSYLLVFAGLGVAFLVMLIPAVLIGSTFPLVGQIGVRDLRKTGASVGRVYAVNTIGNVLGALLPGFVLLGWLGIQRGILAMALLNVSLGFVVLFLRLVRAPARPVWRLALPLVLVAAVIAMSRAPLDFQFPSDGERDYFQTLFYREGPLATTKVYLNPANDEKHMSVDGIVIGGTGFSEFKQLLLAHIPKLLLDDVSNELTVGLGSGILAGESARHSRVKEITGIEIEPSVVAGASLFRTENHDVLENQRLKVLVDDIGNFLRTTTDKYQVISADEKTADEYASNGFSYSLDYYQLLKNHLAPGGLVAQWVPTTLPPSQYRMVLKTFADSFPNVQLWYFLPAQKRGPFNTLLIGSMQRIELDYRQIQRRFDESPEAYASLAPYGLTSADALLPHFVAEDDTIRDAVGDSPINSLDHPRYEFFYPWDYAHERDKQIITNHGFLYELKRAAFPEFLAGIEQNVKDLPRFKQTLSAEFRYLIAFQKFLAGMPLDEQYRIFDDALAVAPWNDSLRARIYAQYSYFASTRSNPAERARLMERANSLYEVH